MKKRVQSKSIIHLFASISRMAMNNEFRSRAKKILNSTPSLLPKSSAVNRGIHSTIIKRMGGALLPSHKARVQLGHDVISESYDDSCCVYCIQYWWYEWWEKSKFFEEDSSSSKPSFVIVLPPPNVTGALHIGHALTATIQVEYVEIKERTPLRVSGYDKPVEFGVLTSFVYPLEGGLGEIIVATTRLETMVGDTTIAIHPHDPRYTHLHCTFDIHPFNGRKLPIVCDAGLVDMNFGTSAVKITPSHDPNDFVVGKQHNLEFINIFTDDGLINSNGGSNFYIPV